jgi:hypothetical protein
VRADTTMIPHFERLFACLPQATEIQAVHAIDHQIEQHNVRCVGPYHAMRLVPVPGGRDSKPFASQMIDKHLPQIRFIFDDEHFDGR